MAKKKITVDAFMAELDHPLKAGVQAVRDIIKGVHPGIGELVKWNAPSYVYSNADFVTFNLWKKDAIHLVFHHPACVTIASPLLEGDYPTRRMLYLSDMADIAAKRAELERIVGEMVRLIAT
ncbi:MAG: DUF1801 domain-containing protein [Chloroflexi bacterium]|nr:DUF1801 domain-containing protein [Chloroflexota bacterium]